MKQFLWITLVVMIVSPGYGAEYSVMDFGAVGDGVTDNTAAFQAALDQAGDTGGGIVNIPTGNFRINGNLSIPRGVTLLGSFRVPPTYTPPPRGSVLMAYAGRGEPEAPPFIRLMGTLAAVGGVIITYPEVSESDVPPIPYPPAIAVLSFADNISVFDTCFLNTYEAMRFIRAGRHLIRNVYGYPIWRGFYIDQCLDVGRVENVHFWPFGGTYNADDPFHAWINTHGVAFEIKRTDWQYFFNTFCFGYGVGYKFSGSDIEPYVGGGHGNFHGIGADCCVISVLIEEAQEHGILISNGEFVGRWLSEDENIGILIEEHSSDYPIRVNLTNSAFWGPLDRAIWQKSTRAEIKVNNSNFLEYDFHAQGSPAIQIDGGRAIISGNSFSRGEHIAVAVGPETQSAIIIGNQSPSGLKVSNQAGSRTQLSSNEPTPESPTGTALLSWLLDVGSEGDNPYLWRWHKAGPLPVGTDWESSMRHSGIASKFIVPVQPGVSYNAQLNLMVSEHARDPEGGIFMGDTRLASLPDYDWFGNLSFVVPASSEPNIELELRCKGWIPAEVLPDSTDRRILGCGVRALRMTADGVSGGYYNLNRQEWVGAEIPPINDSVNLSVKGE